MIPELGQFALIVALVISIVLGTLPIIGAQRGNAILMSVARPAGQGPVRFRVDGLHLSGVVVHERRLQRAQRGIQLQQRSANAV